MKIDGRSNLLQIFGALKKRKKKQSLVANLKHPSPFFFLYGKLSVSDWI